MREPPSKPARSLTSTLVGNAWLRESPGNGSAWGIPRSKSDLRKCVYMPVPPGVLARMSWLPSPPLPSPPKPAPRSSAQMAAQELPRRRNPMREARVFPAYDPALYPRHRAATSPASHVPPPHHVTPRPEGPWRTTPRTPIVLSAEHKARLRQTHRTLRAPSAVHAPVAARGASVPTRAGWDHPLLVGALLFVAPPIGVSLLWTSRRYGEQARLALTIMSGVTMFLVAAVAIAFAIVRHS